MLIREINEQRIVIVSKRLPPLNALKAFEASARLLSFTKAAAELFVTQAAVSHQIKALETYLGLKLFMRKSRALLLTAEGQSYYLDIKDIFVSIQDSTDRLLAKGAKGTITVAIQPSVAIQWLVPRLTEFNKLHPDIDAERLVTPFKEVLVNKDAFYIVCRENQLDMGRIAPFREWVLTTVNTEADIIDEDVLANG